MFGTFSGYIKSRETRTGYQTPDQISTVHTYPMENTLPDVETDRRTRSGKKAHVTTKRKRSCSIGKGSAAKKKMGNEGEEQPISVQLEAMKTYLAGKIEEGVGKSEAAM